jgi:hypothetical protein
MDLKSGRVEIQPATMEIDRNLEAHLVLKAVSPLLDRLELGVHPFIHGTGDWMRDIRHDMREMTFDQVGPPTAA